MKKIFFALSISLIFLSSCDDNTDDIGLSIVPNSDEFEVKVDTFLINTSTYIPTSIYSNTSTYLIGEYNDDVFGTTKAELLAQVIYPSSINVEGAVAEEMSLIVYYNSYVGREPDESIEFKAYEMTQPLNFRTKYYSNLSSSDYTNIFQNLLGSVTIYSDTLNKYKDSTIHSFKIQFPLSFAETFFNDASVYESEENFKNFFKGVCITSTNGNKTMLSVDSVGLVMKYHYTTDATTRTIRFPASKDVKQVNVFSHPGIEMVLSEKPTDIDYLFSPAGFFSDLTLPIGDIKESLNPNKTIALNSARLKIEVDTVLAANDSLPLPSYILLIKKDSVNYFFEQNQLPDSKKVFLARLDTITYTYNYDLTYYLQQKINNNGEDVENMVLIPVTAIYSSSTLSAVKQSTKMYALPFKNKNNASPFKLSIIYNEFYK